MCSDRNLYDQRQHTKRNGNLFGVSFKFVEELFQKEVADGSYAGRGNDVYMFELPVEVCICLQRKLSISRSEKTSSHQSRLEQRNAFAGNDRRKCSFSFQDCKKVRSSGTKTGKLVFVKPKSLSDLKQRLTAKGITEVSLYYVCLLVGGHDTYRQTIFDFKIY